MRYSNLSRFPMGLCCLLTTSLLLSVTACQDDASAPPTDNATAPSQDVMMTSDASSAADTQDAIGTSETGGADANTATDATGVPDVDEPADGDEPVSDVGPLDPPPGSLSVATLLSGLVRPWAFDFLPDGRLLLTRRTGDLHTVDPNDWTLSAPIPGVPPVWYDGQGGLLDVLVDPNFESNSTIYLSYSEPGSNGSAGTAVVSAQLSEEGLTEVTKIFEQIPKVVGPNHFGSRLQFDPTGALMIGLGERFEFMDQAQSLDNHLGKLVRINPDGSVPSDNPFVGDDSALPEIWSYGHRNIQGMAVHPETGVVYAHEHGPKGGDELNRPEAGQNYDWPLASYGDHYWGTVIADDHAGQGFTEPLHYWTPAIAPSGMTFYDGQEFPHWKGNIFMGALVGQHLLRLVMDGDDVIEEEQLLTELGQRIRAVEQGPDGALYVLSDDASNGQLYRLTWE